MATYFVAQGTGFQSQWVIRHLLSKGAKVHTLVRNLETVPHVLKQEGVKLFQGESVEFERVLEASQGCYGAYFNTFPMPDLQAKQIKTLSEACKKAGLETVVLCTTFGTGDEALWDDHVDTYFRSKAELENTVRNAGFKNHIILRPALIHFDYMVPKTAINFPELAESGQLIHAYDQGVRYPQTDASDVGKFVTEALLHPDKYRNQAFDLLNENLTAPEVRDILARVSGRRVTERRWTDEELEIALPKVFLLRFHLWANHNDFTSHIAAARETPVKFGLPLTSLEEGMERDKEILLRTIPA